MAQPVVFGVKAGAFKFGIAQAERQLSVCFIVGKPQGERGFARVFVRVLRFAPSFVAL